MLSFPRASCIYRLEGNGADASWNNATGTPSGGATYATGFMGKGLYFPTAGQLVATLTFPDDNHFLFAAWVKSEVYAGIQTFFGAATSQAIARETSLNHLHLRYYGAGAARIAYFNDFFDGYSGAWVHLCVSIDWTLNRINVFRNGVYLGYTAMTFTPVSKWASGAKNFGSRGSSNWPIIGGYMDEIVIGWFTVAPTEALVKRLMMGMAPVR